VSNRGIRATGAAAAAALAGSVVPAGFAAAEPYSQPLAITGQQAQGMPDGWVHAIFILPQRDQNINRNNVVAFTDFLINGNNTNQAEFAIFSGSSAASFVPVVRSGLELPGLPGVFVKNANTAFGDSGEVAFAADFSGPATNTANNLGFMVGSTPTNIVVLARKGDPVPGAVDAVNVRTFLFPAINSSGLTAVGLFMGGATNTANDRGIYIRQPGGSTLERLIRGGDPTPDDSSQNFLSPSFTRVNNNGQFLAIAGLSGIGISTSNNNALYFGSSSASLTRVAQTGVPISGVAAGLTLATFNATAMTFNDAGKFAGRSTLQGAGTNTSNNDVSFVGTPTGGVSILTREGDAAPGAGSAKFSGAPNTVLTGSGKVVVSTLLTGGTIESGIFAGTTATNLAAVVLDNDPAPGAPAGAKFDSFFSANAFSSVSANAHDQIAFLATLRYTGNANAQEAIYVYDPVQGLVLLARQGGTIEIAPGVTRTIAGIDVGQGGNGQDAQSVSFNDNGTIVFQAQLANGTAGAGTGLFTARVPLVGDVNLDGVINFGDFLKLEARFGATNAARIDGDLNGDHVVTRADFMLLYNNFGNSVDGPVPVSPEARQSLDFFAARVPEPGLLAPALAGLLALRRRNRR
jgi:hypothetical protein